MDTNTTLENKASVKNGTKRMIFAGIAIVLQILVIVLINFRFSQYAEWFAIGLRVLAALLVLFIYNDDRSSAGKMTWIIFIMALPVFGVTLFLLVGLNRGSRKMKERYDEVDAKLVDILAALNA